MGSFCTEIDKALIAASAKDDDNSIEISKLLLAGADPWSIDERLGHNALSIACKNYNITNVRALFSHYDFKKCAVKKGPEGNTPLHYLAKINEKRLTQDFLNTAPDVTVFTVLNDQGRTPFIESLLPMWSAHGCHSGAAHAIFDYMEANGAIDTDFVASLNSHYVSGNTALHFAAASDRSLTLKLLRVGANPNLRNNRDCVPLEWAFVHGGPTADLLIDVTSDENILKQSKGNWLLRAGLSSGLIEVLLDRGADANVLVPTENGLETALMLALFKKNRFGSPAAYLRLLAATSDENILLANGITGSTALHFAVENGHLEIIKGLIQRGANPDLVNKTGQTAYDMLEELDRCDETKAEIIQIMKTERQSYLLRVSGRHPLERISQSVEAASSTASEPVVTGVPAMGDLDATVSANTTAVSVTGLMPVVTGNVEEPAPFVVTPDVACRDAIRSFRREFHGLFTRVPTGVTKLADLLTRPAAEDIRQAAADIIDAAFRRTHIFGHSASAIAGYERIRDMLRGEGINPSARWASPV